MGRHSLHIAAYLSGPKTVALLAAHGANPNARKDGDVTPLIVAIRNPRVPSRDIVRTLLEAGADPNLPDGNGRTPLEWAHECDQHGEITRLLIQHGARPVPPAD